MVDVKENSFEFGLRIDGTILSFRSDTALGKTQWMLKLVQHGCSECGKEKKSTEKKKFPILEGNLQIDKEVFAIV